MFARFGRKIVQRKCDNDDCGGKKHNFMFIEKTCG